MTAPSAARVFGNATGIGIVAGATIGAVVGIPFLMFGGPLVGASIGLFFGLPFGVVNGLALAIVTRRFTGAGAAGLTGALVSAALGVVTCHRLWPGSDSLLPAAMFGLVMGALLAPEAVELSGRQPRSRRPDAMRAAAPRARAIFRRATGIGTATGAVLGAAAGTVVLPLVGTRFGALGAVLAPRAVKRPQW